MKLKTITILLVMLIASVNKLSAQDGPYSEKFNNSFTGYYKKEMLNPASNYFRVLDNAAHYSFNQYNPDYLPALMEIKNTGKIPGKAALDTLFSRAFYGLKTGAMWQGTEAKFTEPEKEVFHLYDKMLCECISGKGAIKYMMDSLVAAQTSCDQHIAADADFIKKMRPVVQNKSKDELLGMQRYMVMYMYQTCPIYYMKLNEAIRYNYVEEGYQDVLEAAKGREAEKVLGWFMEKKYDSLALLFPTYKKFIKEWQQVEPQVKTGSTYGTSHFSAFTYLEKPGITIFLSKNGKVQGRIFISTAAYEIDAKFTALKYIKEKDIKMDVVDPEEIINISSPPPPKVKN